MRGGGLSSHSLDHRPPAVLQAELQLLQDAAALLQLGSGSIRERHVVDGEAPLPVGLQQRGNPVLVQFSPGAEDKHLLHALVLELLCPSASQRHNRQETKKFEKYHCTDGACGRQHQCLNANQFMVIY